MPTHGPSPVSEARGQAAPDLRVAMFGQQTGGAQRQFKETVGLHQRLANTAAARQPGGGRRLGVTVIGLDRDTGQRRSRSSRWRQSGRSRGCICAVRAGLRDPREKPASWSFWIATALQCAADRKVMATLRLGLLGAMPGERVMGDDPPVKSVSWMVTYLSRGRDSASRQDH